MRIAFLGDIHANYHALEAVEAALEADRPDAVICLGDVVGYGAFPARCIEWVTENCVLTVKGNHDHYVSMETGANRFNTLAYRALSWTMEQLSDSMLAWLSALPYMEEYEGIGICHGNPIQPEAWLYVITHHDAEFVFRTTTAQFLVVGHSHIQGCFVKDEGSLLIRPGKPIELSGKRAVLNPGSVGQPRDGDPRAAFALLDTDSWQLTPMRVDYDIEAARDAIIAAGLPVELGDRLRVGH
jgi:putative phosphoesterase